MHINGNFITGPVKLTQHFQFINRFKRPRYCPELKGQVETFLTKQVIRVYLFNYPGCN
jgi:hypothetical protein